MLNETLKDYIIANATPRETQRKRITKLYSELQEYLGKENCFQTGSYARFTAIRPVNDLDIFHVYPNELSTDEALETLPALKERIDSEFTQQCSEEFATELQSHSVKLEFSDNFSIDIVPAVDSGKETGDLNTPIFFVPEESTKEWILSDPKGYREVTKLVDEASEKRLRRCVRFVKLWKIACKEESDDFKLKSFHIEQIFIEMFQEKSDTELADALTKFYTDLPANLIMSRFVDRADSSRHIDGYVDELTSAQKDLVKLKADFVLEKLRNLATLENTDEIAEGLGEIMTCTGLVDENQRPTTPTAFPPSGPHNEN